MLPVRFLLVSMMLALVAVGTWTSARQCNEFICENTCIVNDSCEPQILHFNKECDDPYWGQVGLSNPLPEEICTQCCDESCEKVQTFPNCTGKRCNQCYDGPTGDEATEIYDLECCEVDGEVRCGFKCAVPQGWNADWESDLESQLPDYAMLSMGDADSCGDIPDDDIPNDVQCRTIGVDVTSRDEFCELTRDLKCRGWYKGEKALSCERCLPRSKKAQFIRSSFERLTVLCKAGEAAKCEKVPASIVRIGLAFPPRPCQINLNGVYFQIGSDFREVGIEFFLHVGNPELASKNASGRRGLERAGFIVTYNQSEQNVSLRMPLSYSNGSATVRTQRSGAILNPVTGDVQDHEICVLSIRAGNSQGSSSTVTVENLTLIAGDISFDLGTFSHNSANGGSTVAKFCRDDYGGNFSFTGDITFAGERSEWSVQLECGTRALL